MENQSGQVFLNRLIRPVYGIVILLTLLIIYSCGSTSNKSAEYVTMSTERYMKGEYEDAVKLAIKATEINPDNHKAYVNQAAGYHKMDCTLKVTEPLLLKAYHLKPDEIKTITSLISVYNDNRDYNNASKMADELLENFSHDSINNKTFTLIGKAYKRTDQSEKALRYLMESIKKDSTYIYPYIHLIEICLIQESIPETLEWLRKAEKQEQNASIQNLYAAYYNSIENFDSALFRIDRAIEIETDPVFMANKALYLIRNNQISQGCKMFEKLESTGWKIEERLEKDSEPLVVKVEFCN